MSRVYWARKGSNSMIWGAGFSNPGPRVFGPGLAVTLGDIRLISGLAWVAGYMARVFRSCREVGLLRAHRKFATWSAAATSSQLCGASL